MPPPPCRMGTLGPMPEARLRPVFGGPQPSCPKGIRPVKLSITHNFYADDGPQRDVREAR
jgi:hypothetical protein